MRALTIAVLTLLALSAASCGDVNGANCTPRCTGSTICCSEPNHQVTDGGVGSAWTCVSPASDGSCPKLP